MRIIILALMMFHAVVVLGQRKIIATDTLKISGAIKNELIVSIADIITYPSSTLEDFVLTNQKGEIKDTIRQLKAVPLKLILEKIEFLSDKPKSLNEFYFVFIAADGYKAVYSWNEIFNTETGNHLYLIVEMNGKKIMDMDQRILFLSSTDFKTGRRYISGLEKIIVKRAE